MNPTLEHFEIGVVVALYADFADVSFFDRRPRILTGTVRATIRTAHGVMEMDYPFAAAPAIGSQVEMTIRAGGAA